MLVIHSPNVWLLLLPLRAQDRVAALQLQHNRSLALRGSSHPQQQPGEGEEQPLQDLLVLPIYAAMPPEQQLRVFEPAPPSTRKAILATNIAGRLHVCVCVIASLKGAGRIGALSGVRKATLVATIAGVWCVLTLLTQNCCAQRRLSPSAASAT